MSMLVRIQVTVVHKGLGMVHLSALHPALTLLPPQTSRWPLPIHPSLHFLTHYVSLENFLLCSICPLPTSPTPFQQTHPLNGCSPYRRAGRSSVSALRGRGHYRVSTAGGAPVGRGHLDANALRNLSFYKQLLIRE